MDTIYVDNPLDLRVIDPEDQYGNPLGVGDATASIAIYDALETTAVVATTAMTWRAEVNTWIYQWDPSGLARATYRAKIVLTPNVGPAQQRWVDLDLRLHSTPGPQPIGIPSASQHYLEPWCTEADIPDGRLVDSNGLPLADIQLGWMISAATELLYWLSGRKFRSGRSVIRPSVIARGLVIPQLYPYGSMAGYGQAWGFEPVWAWSALGIGWDQGRDASELVLQGPVRRINSVICDGVTLGSSDYRVEGRRRLVRTNGLVWPLQQRQGQSLAEAGTLEVDYEWGQGPGDAGKLACAELATELALSFSGQDACRLPSRVLSITTQGVTAQVGDALAYLKEQLTGLTICDLFLQATNPMKRRKRSVFLSPDAVLNRSY